MINLRPVINNEIEDNRTHVSSVNFDAQANMRYTLDDDACEEMTPSRTLEK